MHTKWLGNWFFATTISRVAWTGAKFSPSRYGWALMIGVWRCAVGVGRKTK